MSDEKSICAKTEALRVGRKTQHAIYDMDGALLLANGSVVSSELKAQLRKRGIDQVSVHPDDIEDSVPSHSAGLDLPSPDVIAERMEAISSSINLAIKNDGPPLFETAKSPGCSPYDANQHQQLVERFDAAVDLIAEMVQSALGGADQAVGLLSDVANGYVSEMTEDGDHVVATGEELGYSDDICRRSVRMAMLGMAAGMRLGFDRDHVHSIGLCGLVQDWGIYCLPEHLRDPAESFSVDDWSQFMQHPSYTVDALERVKGLSDVIRVGAYQVHEQADGSGYPRGVKNDQIHPYARLLNVVDQYIFLTSASRGRPAYYPYDAVVYLLKQTKRGRFDRSSVRAVVESFSLFPIGSRVRLSNESEARVIRQNGNQHTRPIVEMLPAGESPIIDLASSDLEVVAALPTPGRSDVRLDQQLMDGIIWQGPDT